MSLKNVDIESAMRRLAERRIEEAMREGKFSNLKGAGQPIDLEPAPADENARAAWWALRILRQNDFIPDEVKWRKRIDTLKGMLASTLTESEVRILVGQINDLVQKLNTLGTNAIHLAIAPVSLEQELVKLRERVLERGPAAPQSTWRVCNHSRCKARNAASARYCTRCGNAL